MNPFFKSAVRNFSRNPGGNLINLCGLAIGIACSIFVFLFVKNELSYDRFNANAGRISRVAVEGLIGNTEIQQSYTCAPLAQALYDEFPEVESVVRISKETFVINEAAAYLSEIAQLYEDAEKITLVMDNLGTHKPGAKSILLQQNNLYLAKIIKFLHFV
jgi:putative ABC transport system permease protein